VKLRVLYSFPHKLGAERICTTAWYQVLGVAKCGVEVLACPGAVSRPIPVPVVMAPTLARGRARIPYRILGDMRTFALHDYIVSQRLERLAGQIDIVHAWPLGALRTLKTAARLGIPTVLERPNAHTRFAYEVVRRECDRVGVQLPANHEHAYKEEVLDREEAEYEAATRLLCPSEFVARSFSERGFGPAKLARHQYGYDQTVYSPAPPRADDECAEQGGSGLTVLFVGGAAPRKGLHYALEAWLRSPACGSGKFLIAGQFVPGYAERLSGMLSHESVRVLGHRTDVPQLMRQADVLILSSVEEGSALVTSEARGSGCVLLVSEAAGALCRHQENALVHAVGDVESLAQHLTQLHRNPAMLQQLRRASLDSAHEATWDTAGRKLAEVYQETVCAYRSRRAA